MSEPPLPVRRGSDAAHGVLEPPAGYVVERERDTLLVALPSALDAALRAVRTHGTLYDWAAQSPDTTAFTGRGEAYRVRIDADEWLVRHYRRGGLIGRVIDDSYMNVGESRPLRELRASVAARAAGVPTPEIMAAVVYGSGITYRADLATSFIPHSIELAALTWGDTRWPDARRVAAWLAAGQLLRRAFAAGVHHADLNLRNILIESRGDDVHAWLLDLDRARVDVMSDVAQQMMLDRFHRSRRKLETMAAAAVGAPELAAFEAGLSGGVSG